MLLRAFARRGGLVQHRFRTAERDLLVSLLDDLDERLEGAAADDRDRVLDRLLPEAYRDDPLAELEYRTAVRERAAAAKSAVAARIRADLERAGGGPVRLDAEGATLWLKGLGDLRLAWAARYGDAGTSGAGRTAAVYAWLSWLQSGLVDAVAG